AAVRTSAATDQASPAVAPLAAPPAPAVSPEPVARSAPPSADRQIAMRASAAKKLKQNDALQFAQRKAAARSVVTPPPIAELAATAPPAPPPPPAPPAPLQEVSANAVSGVADQAAAAPSAAKPMPAAASVATDEAARDKGTAQQPGDTPAQELDKIRRLFDQGQREQALACLREVADPAATHNCWAWRIGDGYRFNDDGEPGGTAGRPILQAIDGQQMDGVAVVVTRWYGGTKLGAGGLVRAYGGTAAECLRQAGRIALVAMARLGVHCDFADLPLLKARLKELQGD